MNAHDLAWAAPYQTVVLEGCDGAGKTTLAGRLAAQHGFKVVHCSRTPDSVDLTARYRAILAAPGRIALDRCFLSELVYGPRYRGRSRIDITQAIGLVIEVASRQGLFVHVTAAPPCINARLAARDGGPAPPFAEVEEILRGYDQLFANITQYMQVLCIDTTASALSPGSRGNEREIQPGPARNL